MTVACPECGSRTAEYEPAVAGRRVCSECGCHFEVADDYYQVEPIIPDPASREPRNIGGV